MSVERISAVTLKVANMQATVSFTAISWDLIVVSDVPLTVPPDKLKDIQVVTTIIDDKIVK